MIRAVNSALIIINQENRWNLKLEPQMAGAKKHIEVLLKRGWKEVKSAPKKKASKKSAK